MRRALAVLVLLASAEARASLCVLQPCICFEAAPLVADGHLDGLSDGGLAFVVDAWAGTGPDAGPVGTRYDVGAAFGAAAGERVLVGFEDGGPVLNQLKPLRADGTVTCGTLTLTASQAEAAMTSPDCRAALIAAGAEPSPCPPFWGCNCSQTDGLAFAAILPLWWRRRRRGGGP